MMPIIFLEVIASWPSMYATYADTTGTIDVNILALAIPSSFIELINRIKARHEHRTDRYNRGIIIDGVRFEKENSL